MVEEEASPLRVVFYGANVLAAVWHVQRVAELAEQFDPLSPPTTTEDILELHNVQQYLEHDFFPKAIQKSSATRPRLKLHRFVAQ